ncbi:unnamed protein product, partial [Mesorhabditis belari]|uniref:Transcription initiation factor IIA subunit 2 n=1 Tax=Mesorhabditis belari TaxID=2138241 RepID=A0AAF3EJU6_9BILA
MAYQHYRETTLGQALMEILDEYLRDGVITDHLKNKTLATFDRVISAALHDTGKHKAQFIGEKLVAYRYCDNVWSLMLKNVTFSDQTRTFDSITMVDRMKIVALDGRETTLAARRPPGT